MVPAFFGVILGRLHSRYSQEHDDGFVASIHTTATQRFGCHPKVPWILPICGPFSLTSGASDPKNASRPVSCNWSNRVRNLRKSAVGLALRAQRCVRDEQDPLAHPDRAAQRPVAQGLDIGSNSPDRGPVAPCIFE